MAETEQTRQEIPDAGGLVKTLNQRAKGRWTVSEPQGSVSESGTHYIIETDVLVDDAKIGTVKTTHYQWEGVLRLASISYNGTMPGYTNPCDGKPEFGMTACEYPPAEAGQLRYSSKNLEQLVPNNTPENPVYRHDGHRGLSLADHEVPLVYSR